MNPRELKLALKAFRDHILSERGNVDRMIGPMPKYEITGYFKPLGYTDAEIKGILTAYERKYSGDE
jgi:hypothetical protein